MRDSARAVFPALSADYEGRVPCFYQDRKKLVTIGIGCLAEFSGKCPSDVLDLPFVVVATGQAATEQSILDDWQRVKDTPGLDVRGWTAAQHVAKLQLGQEAIDGLLLARLAVDEAEYRQHLAGWLVAPASAQVGALSMAWAVGAMGVIGGFPRFCAAWDRQDWGVCALECRIDAPGDASVARRNAATVRLFASAADGGDPDAVAWP